MSNVIKLAASWDVDGNPIEIFDAAIATAINTAVNSGVATGHIIAILHGRLTIETNRMIKESFE